MSYGTNGNGGGGAAPIPANPGAAHVVASLDSMMSPEVATVLAQPGPPPVGLPGPLPPDPMSAPISAFDPSAFRTPRTQAPQQVDKFGSTNPGLRKFGALQKAIPGAEKVRLRKRMPDGHLVLIGDWSLREIQSAGDIDAFVLQYAVPLHKGGRYVVSIFDARNQEYEAGDVITPETVGPAVPHGDPVTMRLIDKLDSMERKMLAPTVPPPDPFETYKKVQAQVEEMKKQGMDGTTAVMLAMQQSQRPAGPDPYMIEQMATMRAELAALKAAPAPMPLPPMAPPSNPMMDALAASMPALVAALVTKLTAPPTPDPNAFTAKEAIALLTAKPPERDPVMEFRESLRFFRDLQGGQKEESIKDKLAEIAAIKELATDIVGGPSGPQNTNFFDALVQLFSNKGFGDNLGAAIGQEIKARQQQKAPAALPANTTPAPNQGQQIQPQPAPADQRRVAVPENMRDLCAAMEGADTDETRAQAVVRALSALEPHPQWKEFVHALLGAVAGGEKQKALNMLANWMKFLVENRLFAEPAALRCLKTFGEQFDAIQMIVRAQMGMKSIAAPAPAPAGKPPVVTPPPPTTPDEEEEEEEGEGGEDADEEEEEGENG